MIVAFLLWAIESFFWSFVGMFFILTTIWHNISSTLAFFFLMVSFLKAPKENKRCETMLVEQL